MPGKASDDNRYVIQVAVKVLDVLFTFREPPHHHNLADLCLLTGQPKNQVYRCIKTLESYGLVRADADGRYWLTPLIGKLAPVAGEEGNLIDIARPVMDDLAARTGETINLITLMDDLAVIIDRRESKKGIRLSSQLGARVPLHAGAVPKVLLAFLPPERQAKVLAMVPFLPKYTDRTVTDPVLLQAEIQTIRHRGYSLSDEDFDQGARGVGAPILDSTGQVVAGISVGGPITRITDEVIPELAAITMAAAARISRQMGYLPSTVSGIRPPLA